MTELSLDPDTGDDTAVVPDRRPTAGSSRWQKVVGIIGIVVILWVGSQLFDQIFDSGPGGGPGDHGPGGDETPADDQEQETETEDEDDHAPPQGDH